MTDILTEKDIEPYFKNTNFGSMANFDVVKYGLLKCACGYYQGYTSTTILTQLGLITKKYNITKLGKEHLWEWFSDNSKI